MLKQTRKLSRHHACVRGRYHELFRDGSGGGGGGLALLFDKYAALDGTGGGKRAFDDLSLLAFAANRVPLRTFLQPACALLAVALRVRPWRSTSSSSSVAYPVCCGESTGAPPPPNGSAPSLYADSPVYWSPTGAVQRNPWSRPCISALNCDSPRS